MHDITARWLGIACRPSKGLYAETFSRFSRALLAELPSRIILAWEDLTIGARWRSELFIHAFPVIDALSAIRAGSCDQTPRLACRADKKEDYKSTIWEEGIDISGHVGSVLIEYHRKSFANYSCLYRRFIRPMANRSILVYYAVSFDTRHIWLMPAHPVLIISIPTIWLPGLRSYRPTLQGGAINAISLNENSVCRVIYHLDWLPACCPSGLTHHGGDDITSIRHT
jgi:hypothetical protein